MTISTFIKLLFGPGFCPKCGTQREMVPLLPEHNFAVSTFTGKPKKTRACPNKECCMSPLVGPDKYNPWWATPRDL